VQPEQQAEVLGMGREGQQQHQAQAGCVGGQRRAEGRQIKRAEDGRVQGEAERGIGVGLGNDRQQRAQLGEQPRQHMKIAGVGQQQ
jgi:hypothetical protein